jgi:hypothetical protein
MPTFIENARIKINTLTCLQKETPVSDYVIDLKGISAEKLDWPGGTSV